MLRNTSSWCIFRDTLILRLCILACVAVSGWLLEDDDTSNEARGFSFAYNWDAIYFEAQAKRFSMNESLFSNVCIHHSAFLPGYTALTWPWYYIGGVWGAVIFNALVYSSASVVLFQLSGWVANSKDCSPNENRHFHLGLQSVRAFAIIPAGIFSVAMYSDVCYAFFQFLGILHYMTGSKWKAACVFMVASCIRSNGLLNAGFFLFEIAVLLMDAIRGEINPFRHLIKLLLCIGFVIGPFFLHNFIQYQLGCAWRPVEEIPLECKIQSPFTLYARIQHLYWDVGFLNQWKIQPADVIGVYLLIASPVLMITSLGIPWCHIFYVVLHSFRPLFDTTARKYKHAHDDTSWKNNQCLSQKHVYAAVHVQLLFSVLLGLSTAHIQVIPRIVFSSPAFYWAVVTGIQSKSNLFRYATLVYLIVWNILGITLFTNFYAWT